MGHRESPGRGATPTAYKKWWRMAEGNAILAPGAILIFPPGVVKYFPVLPDLQYRSDCSELFFAKFMGSI
jgi:hypothetical protein